MPKFEEKQEKEGMESSILEIIEQMVKEGKSEKDIFGALRGLGIKEEQARKLLLLGEADTYALLRNEIKKIVKEDMEREEAVLVGVIQKMMKSQEQELEQKVEGELEKLRTALSDRMQKVEKTEKKGEKIKELMRILDEPGTTHGIEFNEVSTERKKKKQEEGFREVKL